MLASVDVILLAVDVQGDVEALVVALLGAFLIAVAGGFWRLIVRLNKQDALLAANKDTLQRMESNLTRQFGTNGFVLKDQMKGLRDDLNRERGRLDDHLESHAYGRRKDDS